MAVKISKNPVTWKIGADNMGGYKPFVLFVPEDYCSTVPVIPTYDEIDDEENSVVAKGAFTFKEVGFKPKYIKCTDKTVTFKADNQGDIEGQSYKLNGEFFRAGALKDAAGFARLVKNTSGYVILEDMDGNQIIVGQPGLPCVIKPAFEGGTNREDRRGHRFTFEADSHVTIAYLETKIDISELLQ